MKGPCNIMEKIRNFLNRNRLVFAVISLMLIATLIYRYTNNVFINLVLAVFAVSLYVWFLKNKWNK